MQIPFKVFNYVFEHPDFLTSMFDSCFVDCNFHGVGKIWYKLKNVKNNLKNLHKCKSSVVGDKVNFWCSCLIESQVFISHGSVNSASISHSNDAYCNFKKWLQIENSILSNKVRIKWISNADESITRLFYGHGHLL